MNAGRPSAAIVLIAVLALLAAGWVRWSSLDWGPAWPPFHPDEPSFATSALALETGGEFRRSYVLGLSTLLAALLPAPAGEASDYLAAAVRCARWLSFAAGLALPLVVYLLARRLERDRDTALLAAALVAVNTLAAIHSHFGTADMLYVVLVTGFAACALRGQRLTAAGLAGLAMAMKFGLILLPSLVLLAWPVKGQDGSRPRRSWAALPLALLVFLAAQGFRFDQESVTAILRSFSQDNTGGFEHAKTLNALTYAGVMVRSLGFPAAALCIAGLLGLRWRGLVASRERIAALLPFALHGAGLLAIATSFPRHALPLIPLAAIAAAAGLARIPERLRGPLAGVAVAWSAVLMAADGDVFRHDPREKVQAALATAGAGPVWADLFYKLTPPEAVAQPNLARRIVVNEAWTWRFERSEVNPLRAPTERELYHATPSELAWYRHFRAGVAGGHLRLLAEGGPLLVLPEQRLYDAAWGSFEKFAGRCAAYELTGPP